MNPDVAIPISAVAADGWACASAPVCGDPLDLLRRQVRVPLPAKIVSGPQWLAEMPVEIPANDAPSALASVRLFLEQAIAAASSEDADPLTLPALDTALVADKLKETCVEWTQDHDEFIAKTEAIRITAKIAGAAVLFQTDLLRFHQPSDNALRALAHFSLALNARLRFARASLLDDRLVLEVPLPLSAVTPSVVNKALGALRIGADVARKECVALSDEGTAAQYMQFQQGEPEPPCQH